MNLDRTMNILLTFSRIGLLLVLVTIGATGCSPKINPSNISQGYTHGGSLNKEGEIFKAMENSNFAFEAYTRVWFIRVEDVPENIRTDLTKVRAFAANSDSVFKMNFVGEVEIHRGVAQPHPNGEGTQLPMVLTRMEEYGYVPELKTTFRLSGQADNPSFGYTNPMVPGNETPADARMLLNLEIEAVSGKYQGLMAKKTCTTKKVKANIPSFPFTNSGVFFTHVGDNAVQVGEGKNTIGYIINGIMTPQMALPPSEPSEKDMNWMESVSAIYKTSNDITTKSAKADNWKELATEEEWDFLMGN